MSKELSITAKRILIAIPIVLFLIMIIVLILYGTGNLPSIPNADTGLEQSEPPSSEPSSSEPSSSEF